MADIHRHGLTKSLSELLSSFKYSDFTVRCGSEEFKLHRAIVCPRSRFFAAACDGRFRETETSVIVLEEDDLPTVRRMFTYLYTLDYDDEGDTASAQHYMANATKLPTPQALATTRRILSAEELLKHNKMMNNVAVCAIAQKYDIDELKELAKANFRELWLSQKVPNHGLYGIIDAVFETTTINDPGLRNVVVEYCADHHTEIVRDDALCSIIKDNGEFGLALLRKRDERASTKLANFKDKIGKMLENYRSVERIRAGRNLMMELGYIYNTIDDGDDGDDDDF